MPPIMSEWYSDESSATQRIQNGARREAATVLVWLGCLGIRRMTHVVVTANGTRLLTATLYANEYLAVQIKGAIGRLNLLESQLATAKGAARRGRRLHKSAHKISFRPICFGTRKRDTRKDPN